MWVPRSCVGVEEEAAAEIDLYHCPKCEVLHGPSVSESPIALYGTRAGPYRDLWGWGHGEGAGGVSLGWFPPMGPYRAL